MLLLDRKERDRRLHKEISRTDCWKTGEKQLMTSHFKRDHQHFSQGTCVEDVDNLNDMSFGSATDC